MGIDLKAGGRMNYRFYAFHWINPVSGSMLMVTGVRDPDEIDISGLSAAVMGVLMSFLKGWPNSLKITLNAFMFTFIPASEIKLSVSPGKGKIEAMPESYSLKNQYWVDPSLAIPHLSLRFMAVDWA